MRLTIIEKRPRARPRAEALRTRGLALVAVAFATAVVLQEVQLAAPARTVALVLPLAVLAAGALLLLRSLDESAHVRATERVARQLRAALPDDCVVLPRYLPRDSGDGEVDLVVVGPPGVFAIEVRDLPGDVVCYQDVWYQRGERRSQRLAESPSRVARWNASRVRGDLANGGFAKTAVEPVVVIARGHLVDVASACVPVVEGVPALAAHLAHRNGTAISLQRAQAITEALRGLQLAAAS